MEDVRRQVNEAIEARQVRLSLFLSLILTLLALRIMKIESLEPKPTSLTD